MNAKKGHTTVHRAKDARTSMEDTNVLVSFQVLNFINHATKDDLIRMYEKAADILQSLYSFSGTVSQALY